MANQNQNTQNNTNAPYRFSPIFPATVTPGPVEILTGAKGEYARMRGSKVVSARQPEKTLTVMAFGKSLEDVRDLLEEGSSVDLAVQYDGGSMKIIGLPRPKAANEGEEVAAAA